MPGSFQGVKMERYAICLFVVIMWAIVVLITAVVVFGEDERPREPKAPLKWIAYDRVSMVSAQILRRYRRRGRHKHGFILRDRSPPLIMYWS